MSGLNNPSPGTPEDGLRHARSDLAVARDIENNPEVLPNQTAFHAHQAAEKARKAVMIRRRIAFPRTHDLTELVKRWTDSGQVWPPVLMGVKTLNPYAVEFRYPGYIHQLSHAEVRAAIETAAPVVTWAEAALTPPQPPSGAKLT